MTKPKRVSTRQRRSGKEGKGKGELTSSSFVKSICFLTMEICWALLLAAREVNLCRRAAESLVGAGIPKEPKEGKEGVWREGRRRGELNPAFPFPTPPSSVLADQIAFLTLRSV